MALFGSFNPQPVEPVDPITGQPTTPATESSTGFWQVIRDAMAKGLSPDAAISAIGGFDPKPVTQYGAHVAQGVASPVTQAGDYVKGAYQGEPLRPSSELVPWAAGTAMGMVGGGTPFARFGALGSAGGKPIRAYHSSPHDFERFDLSKMGTGEGAQMYGPGMYFAENPKVSGQGGQYWKEFAERFKGPEHGAAMMLQEAKFNRPRAIETAARELEQEKRFLAGVRQKHEQQGGDTAWLRSAEAIAKIRQDTYDLLKSNQPVGPRTYEVAINAPPEKFLDWDRPLSQQPHLPELPSTDATRVLREYLKAGGSEPVGGDLYRALTGYGRPGEGASRQAVTAMLERKDVPGIRYADQGSRYHPSLAPNNPLTIEAKQFLDAAKGNAIQALRAFNESGAERNFNAAERREIRQVIDAARRDPTRNYVVFDPGIVDILKKYAVPGLLGTGAAASQLKESE